MEISATARRVHSNALVIDAHVHPSLKTYLFKKKLWKTHRSGGAFNPFTMRVDLPKTIAGGVDARQKGLGGLENWPRRRS